MSSRIHGSQRDGGTGDAHESVFHHSLTEVADALVEEPISPQKKQKICCVCGKDVAGEQRFKDKQGRYWCYDCGKTDSAKKHASDEVKCPECGVMFRQTELVEHGGVHVCEACRTKRVLAEKREKARIAAAEEEGRRQQAMRRRLVIMGSAVLAALVLCAVVIMAM